MNCTNCGSPIPEGMASCPTCGTAVNNQQVPGGAPVVDNGMQQNAPVQPAMPPQQPMGAPTPVGSMPPIKNRSFITAILLTFVTCGIYGLYWMVCMTDESNSLSDNNKTASGGMTILLILVTCGVYGIYWYFKMGKKLHEAGLKYGRQVSDNSIIYLVLGLLGLGVVSECMIQNDLNKFANQ